MKTVYAELERVGEFTVAQKMIQDSLNDCGIDLDNLENIATAWWSQTSVGVANIKQAKNKEATQETCQT